MVMLASSVFTAVAQITPFEYGNAWYRPQQPWLKLKTWRDGIYSVSAADLTGGESNTFMSANLPD
jgi:hypothetical protein